MSDMKLAADAIRSLAEWKDRALKAEAKVASFEHRARVDAILKKAETKGAVLPKDVDLMKCSEEDLRSLERSLEMIVPNGGIKLASIDDSQERPANKKRSELDEFLLNPEGFGGL